MPEYKWISDKIFTVSGFFTPEECDAEIRRAESAGFSDAPITTPFGPQMRQDVRNNTRVMIDDPDGAEQLWRRATDYVPIHRGDWTAVGVNERLRFYRYDAGQQFDWHFDGAFERLNGDRSQLTFMVYLNDDFQGGETSFEDGAIVPETGMALFFVHRIRHKGEPVAQGRKYVLRTDVMYRQSAE
ncbi:prolyl hydroxylase family protein [Lignipirellula cremea]|uniref:Fe2OG dioxygenase domain-containing protein n=1 Tax=Lignipirellula cremea TaxID=2528010 RepID=A0A518DZR9_9BACT|nr:2OG-Fe(II) oxygenase [Lignipirellula cremea]QDU97333.1 hypothetical protein Pla8534_51790 [Lignipirellula cremea]